MASASLVDWPVWSLHAAMFVFSKGTLDCWVAGSAWCWCWWLSARAVIDTTTGVAWWNCDQLVEGFRVDAQ